MWLQKICAIMRDPIKCIIIKGSFHCFWIGSSDHIVHMGGYFFLSYNIHHIFIYLYENLPIIWQHSSCINKYFAVKLATALLQAISNTQITWICEGFLKCWKMSHHMFPTNMHTHCAQPFSVFLLCFSPLFSSLFLSFFHFSFSSISTSIYSQFVFLCSHITKVMGWLVKNIFAFATLFFCGDLSSTHVGLCI